MVFVSVLSAQNIRKPVWAGQFYDADADRLGAQIDGFLAAADPTAPAGEIRVLIVPHAGYIYSGRVAAFGYKLVQGGDFETVVILGPSHRIGFEGASIWPEGGFETPFGTAAVDAEASRFLSRTTGFRFSAEAHAEEHSVEVQVPFIQKVLPRAKIVPVVMGLPSETTLRTMADALAGLALKKKILVVASTDMSHFLSKKEANALDKETADLVKALRTNLLLRNAQANENRMCGRVPVLTAIYYAQKMGLPRVHVLRYDDSAAAGGPDDRVVGYMAAAVTMESVRTGAAKPAIPVAAEPPQTPPPSFALSAEEKKELLGLARRTLESFVREGLIPPYETENPRFIKPRGAFVTLTKKGGLRGCIGFIEAVAPLHQAVRQLTAYAASEDPRFPPVTAAELKDISVEISVLSPPVRIEDPRLVQVGKHGLVIAEKGRRGLLLPQVATENKWDRLEFLDQACLKAGLPPDAWKKGAEISIFEALVFR
jgi:hypothetical protein